MFPTMGSWWSMADGKVVIDTGLDTSGFEKGVKSLPSKTSGITSSLKGIAGAAAAAFSVKAIVDFGKAAVEIGSNIAEVQNVVDTSFGDMSYKVEAFAGTAIEQFGMSALSAKKTASTYMSMARGMGLNEEAASDMSISLAGLTGDVASFYNISQELADTKLKSVFTGETETLKDLGVVMTQANLKAYAMSQGITKSLDSMSQAELVGLRYNYVMNSLSLAQGDFAKTSGSWANQTRILSENWKEFMSVMGQGLIQVLTPLLQVLNQIISAFTTVVKSLFPSMSESSGAIQSAASGAGSIASGMESATEAAKEFKKTTAGFDELQILSSGSEDSKSAGNSQPTLMPSIAPIEGLGGKEVKELSGLAASIEKILAPFKNISFDNLSKSFGKLKNALKPITKKLFEGLEWGLENVLAPLSGFVIEDVLPRFLDTLSIATDGLGVIMSESHEFFKQFIDEFIAPIAEFTVPIFLDFIDDFNAKLANLVETIKNSEAFEDLRSVLSKIYDFLVPIINKLTEIQAWFRDFVVGAAFLKLEEVWKNLEDAIGLVAAILDGDFSDAWEHFKDLMVDNKIDSAKEKLDFLKEKFGEVKETVSGWVTHWKESITDFINTWKEKITGWWDENVAPWFTAEKWNEVLQGMVDGFADAWNKVYDFFTVEVPKWWNDNIAPWFTAEKWSEIWNNVKEGVKAGWNKVVAFFTESIPAWWNEHIAPWFTKKKWTELLGKVKEAFVSVFEGIKNAIKVPINAIIGFINKIIGGLNKLHIDVPAIKGITDGFTIGFNIPTIPELAQGAVLPANKPFLAMLGDQTNGTNIEAPLSTIEQAVENVLGRQGTDGPYTIVLQVGSQRLGSVVLQSLRDISRQNGGLALDLR